LQAPSLCTGHKKRSQEAGAAADRSDRNDVFEVERIVDRHILKGSSAGLERMFSKAGKLHDDLKASQSDESLEHALLAAANCV
jgi:hypothetical protein